MCILKAARYRTMPWKNGGGSTTEVAVSPEGAGLDTFDWRISMAVVAADGPFSAFPDIDRTLSILDGAGLVLHGLGDPVRLLPGTAPFAFPADAAVSAALLAGPITDLNVMTRRGRFHDRTSRLAAGTMAIAPETATAFLLADAPCTVAVDGCEPIRLDPRDAMRLDGAGGRTLTLSGAGSPLGYLVELIADRA